MLNSFLIPKRELNEILYDYLDKRVKPTFSIGFDTVTIINEEGEQEKYDIIRITCLKCCGIKKNPNFTDSGIMRPYFKKTNTIKVFNNSKIKDEIKNATYFEWKDKNKVTKGHYDFPQLSAREKYIIANYIFRENERDIPESFRNCVDGICE